MSDGRRIVTREELESDEAFMAAEEILSNQFGPPPREEEWYDVYGGIVEAIFYDLPERTYVDVVEEFKRVLASGDLIGPALAMRLAMATRDHAQKEGGYSPHHLEGMVEGAAAMYRALTGRPQ